MLEFNWGFILLFLKTFKDHSEVLNFTRLGVDHVSRKEAKENKEVKIKVRYKDSYLYS